MFSTFKDFSGLPEPIHTLISKDMTTMKGICIVCGPVPIRKVTNGLHWACGIKRKDQYRKYNQTRASYRDHLKDACERCGFHPEDQCQMDIHHLDGNHNNDTQENLQTLCVCCHRLVTKRDGEIRRLAEDIARVWKYRSGIV